MSKRIYTFEVEIDDVAVHDRYNDGTCDHRASVSCEDSIGYTLNEIGRDMARMSQRGASLIDKVTFEESYTENDWEELNSRPAGRGIAVWNAR